jgi:hypothetical protein
MRRPVLRSRIAFKLGGRKVICVLLRSDSPADLAGVPGPLQSNIIAVRPQAAGRWHPGRSRSIAVRQGIPSHGGARAQAQALPEHLSYGFL